MVLVAQDFHGETVAAFHEVAVNDRQGIEIVGSFGLADTGEGAGGRFDRIHPASQPMSAGSEHPAARRRIVDYEDALPADLGERFRAIICRIGRPIGQGEPEFRSDAALADDANFASRSSIIWREMAKPSPTPPYLRVLEVSTWENL